MKQQASEAAARVAALCGAIHELKVEVGEEVAVVENEPRFCAECGTKMKVALPLGFHFCPLRCVCKTGE